MRIAVAEMLYPMGHLVLAKNYIRSLQSLGEVVVFDNNNYFSSLNLSDEVKIVNVRHRRLSDERFAKIKKCIPFAKYDFFDFILQIFNAIEIALKQRKYNCDRVIFFSVRNDSLVCSLPFFKRNTVSAFHHNDIDHLANRWHERFIFNLGRNKYNHIVLASFIKDGLISEFNVNAQRVFVVYQPLLEETVEIQHKVPLVIGLGQTIDSEILKRFIELDKQITEKRPYHIILRNKSIEYKGNNLTVINSYLSRDEYNKFLKEATICLVYYPQVYRLRYSGIIDDILNYGGAVYGSDIEVVRYFAEQYPNSCKVVSPEQLFAMNDVSNCMADKNEVLAFREKHSAFNIQKQFKLVLE